MSLKAFSCFSSQLHVFSFFNSYRMGTVFFNNFGMCLAKYCTDPKNDRISFMFWGDFDFRMASVLARGGFISFFVILYPSHSASGLRNFDFSLLALYPAFSNFLKTSPTFI